MTEHPFIVIQKQSLVLFVIWQLTVAAGQI
jgi:hypothetical protein